MQWCVKKENESTWSRVKLQEDAIEAMENLSETITIFSKMKYHVTVLDRSIDFLVELSSASTCNNGDYFTNISLWIQQKGKGKYNLMLCTIFHICTIYQLKISFQNTSIMNNLFLQDNSESIRNQLYQCE